jgi:hypothetical protein
MAKKDWTNRGKTISGLIRELQTFENQELEVRISIDDGKTSFPISLVGRQSGKYALLMNCEEKPSIIKHDKKAT